MSNQRIDQMVDRGIGQRAVGRRTLIKGIMGTGLSVAFATSMADLLKATPAGAATLTSAAQESTQTYATATNPFLTSWTVPLGNTIEAPGGAGLAVNLAAQVNTPQFPYDIGMNQMPYFVVPANQAMVTVTGGVGNTGGRIPIPAAAIALVAKSPDSPLVIFQPSSDTVWEIWQAEYSGSAWTASDAGVIVGCAASSGTFPSYYGLSASGITYAGTIITQADLARCAAGGKIGHVLAMQTADEQMPYLPPAVRNDNGGIPSVAGSPPEGTWFRMPAAVPMPAGLPPVAQYVFTALQEYGCVVVDHAGGVYFQFEDSASWAANGMTGTDPLTKALGSAATYDALANIPLSSMKPIIPLPLGAAPGTAPGTVAFTVTPANQSLVVAITSVKSATPVSQYIVTHRVSGTGPRTVLTPYLSGSSTGTTITGLKAGTSYEVSVTAVNAVTLSTPTMVNCVAGSAGGGNGAVASVVQTSATGVYNDVTSAAQTLPKVTAGNVLVLMSMVTTYGAQPTPELQSVSGGPSGIKWTKVAASTVSTPTYEVGMWVGTGYASSSSPITVTAEYAKAGWPQLVLMECAGVSQTSPVDAAGANDTYPIGPSSTAISATVTPAKTGNLLVACCYAEANAVLATAPNWANNSGSSSETAWQWMKVGTASPQTAKWTVAYNGGAASIVSLNAG